MKRSVELKMQAQKFRRDGMSYSEITREIGVPQSTLSTWFSKKRWSRAIERRLREKYEVISRARLAVMNESRRLKKIEREKVYLREAEFVYDRRKNDPLFVAGIAIYWGEGEKIGNGRLSVINTDEGALKVMVNFYEKVLGVPKEKIRAGLFVYSDLDEACLLRHWSKELGLPRSQFIKSQMLVSKKSSTKRKSAFGICNVYVSKSELKFKMLQWIRMFAAEFGKIQ